MGRRLAVVVSFVVVAPALHACGAFDGDEGPATPDVVDAGSDASGTTPEAGLVLGTMRFDQPGCREYVVPAGAVRVGVRAWGAGGGAGSPHLDGAGVGGRGGAGAFVSCVLSVPGGTVLDVCVGTGGSSPKQGGGGGGGLSSVGTGDDALVVAGGGGGGSIVYGSSRLVYAGGHAGAAGANGEGGTGGAGATEVAAGPQSHASIPATAGAEGRGGGGQDANASLIGTTVGAGGPGGLPGGGAGGGPNGAGGGGAGRFGGAGGAVDFTKGAGGGGGGSSTCRGDAPKVLAGVGHVPPNDSAPDYVPGIARGGESAAGGNGLVVLVAE